MRLNTTEKQIVTRQPDAIVLQDKQQIIQQRRERAARAFARLLVIAIFGAVAYLFAVSFVAQRSATIDGQVDAIDARATVSAITVEDEAELRARMLRLEGERAQIDAAIASANQEWAQAALERREEILLNKQRLEVTREAIAIEEERAVAAITRAAQQQQIAATATRAAIDADAIAAIRADEAQRAQIDRLAYSAGLIAFSLVALSGAAALALLIAALVYKKIVDFVARPSQQKTTAARSPVVLRRNSRPNSAQNSSASQNSTSGNSGNSAQNSFVIAPFLTQYLSTAELAQLPIGSTSPDFAVRAAVRMQADQFKRQDIRAALGISGSNYRAFFAAVDAAQQRAP